MNRTRLDAESVHDAVLAISGKLDLTMGGPSVKQFIEMQRGARDAERATTRGLTWTVRQHGGGVFIALCSGRCLILSCRRWIARMLRSCAEARDLDHGAAGAGDDE